MNTQKPFLNKQVIPGGVLDLIDRKPKGVQTSGPVLDKTKNMDLGDILTFNYIGRELIEGDTSGTMELQSDRIVLNPLVVFAGYDQATQCILGVDLKRFILDKQTAQLNVLFFLLKKYYYYQEDTKLKLWCKRSFKEVPYSGSIAFKYDNFGGAYGAVGKHLLRYFKSYKPRLMRQVSIIPPDLAEIEIHTTIKSIPKTSK